MPSLNSILRHLQPKQVKRLLRKSKPSAGGMVAAGDRARDARDWNSAAEAYRAALKINPELAPIWVQLGHALKESGDVRAALEAYKRAIDLEPSNSDTALQLGHAWKLLKQPDEAKGWYEKALQLPPGEMAATGELLALGVRPDRVEELLVAQQREDVPLGIGPLIWDISDVHVLRTAGRPVPMDLLWSAEVAVALAKLGVAIPAVADPVSLEWHCLDVSGEGSIGADVTKLARMPLPSDVSGLVLTPSPSRDVDDMQWRAVASLHKVNNIPLIAFLPSATLWEVPLDARSSQSRLRVLDQAFSACSMVIVPCPLDRELVEGRVRRAGRGHLVALDREHSSRSRDPARVLPGAAVDLVLSTSSVRELELIWAAHSLVDNGARLAILEAGEPGSADLDSIIEALKVARPDCTTRLDVVPPANALEQLARARSLVLPATNANAGLWSALARERGVPVLASFASTSLRGLDTVDEFVDFERTEQAAVVWRDVRSRSAREVGAESERWARAIQRVFADLRASGKPLPAPEGFTVRFGQFHGFTSGGAGLRLRSGSGWLPPMAHGSRIDAAGASLLLRLNYLHKQPCKLALLMGAPASTSEALEISLSTAPGQTVQRSLPKPWGWVVVDCPMQRGKGQVVEIQIRITGRSARTDPDAEPVVTGLVAYPQEQDLLWHQFLDRASRGLVPELAAVRSWADRR